MIEEFYRIVGVFNHGGTFTSGGMHYSIQEVVDDVSRILERHTDLATITVAKVKKGVS